MKPFVTIQQFFKNPWHLHNLAICVTAIISGLVAVFYTKLFRYCEAFFLNFNSQYPEFIFILTPSAFLIAWFLIFKFSIPAKGSGIPQVLIASSLLYKKGNIPFIQKLLSIHTIFIKILSSCVCALGGGVVGREGPTIQISAGIFHAISEKISKKVPKIDPNLWIITGAGAGLAAAFNTPLGGIIYTIEELGSTHLLRMRNIILVSVIISGLVAQGFLGNYLFLGSPEISPNQSKVWQLTILIGFVSGFIGALWSQIAFYFYRLLSNIKSFKRAVLIPVILGLILATLIYFNKYTSGSGVSLVMNFLYEKNNPDASIFIFRFFGTLVSAISGVAGGIFSPSLALGATIGHVFSIIFSESSNHLFILIGMIGFLTGVARIPFTASILVFEMTGENLFLFPMMTAGLCALLGAQVFGHHSFYDLVKMNMLIQRKNNTL